MVRRHMKILWIVNMVLPDLGIELGVQTSASGSWMEDLSQKVAESKDIQLAVAAIGGDTFQDITIGKIRYFLIPGNGKTMMFYNHGLVKYWQQIYENFPPDIVHLHGTEYSHGVSFLRTYPKVKSVVSIQGIISRIKDVDLEGFSIFALLCYRTFKENVKLNGMIENHFLNRYRIRFEHEILKRVQYANVVNFWDMSVVKSINPDLRCIQIDYNLRDCFYSSPKWDIGSMKRYTIFTNPGGVPIKGLHNLLKALQIVKSECPEVKLLVPGMVVNKEGRLVVVNGYAKYIKSLIRDLDLKDNIEFLGRLDAAQMVDQMLRAHVVVIPSAIEGTSLMLREAMFLGVPAIASFRGGMSDFVRDKESGYLYDYPEYPCLAYRILDVFNNDETAAKFSANAIKQAEEAHNRCINPQKYSIMYKMICENDMQSGEIL